MKTAQLNRHSHSVSLLNYHLILVVKYRRKVIDNSISDNLKTIFNSIAVKSNIQVKEWNHDKDHIHVLFEATPSTHFVSFINSYKSCSIRIIKSNYHEISQNLWKQSFWSTSYFIVTVGGALLSILKTYIE
jgi:putative transposase